MARYGGPFSVDLPTMRVLRSSPSQRIAFSSDQTDHSLNKPVRIYQVGFGLHGTRSTRNAAYTSLILVEPNIRNERRRTCYERPL